MRLLYSIVLYMVSPLVVLRLLLNSLRNPEYRSRIPERFGRINFFPDQRPVLWLHAVSVGEVQAARPLLARLLRQYPGYRLLVSTITPTGATTVKQAFSTGVEHCYLPYDLPHALRKFIHVVQPSLLIIMETEIWPNLVHYCEEAGIKKVLVNARISDTSYRGYRRLGSLIRRAVAQIDLIVAQSERDAGRLLSLGARPGSVIVTGNLKFDVDVASSVIEQAQSIRRTLSVNRPVFIAASTHEGEEVIVLEAFREIRGSVPECLLILAPRHPDRAGAVVELCREAGFSLVSRTRDSGYTTDTDIYLLDTLGELSIFYACADVAFVGGSLVKSGGHNMLEPASIGIPVISGPYIFNFRDIVDMLSKENALVLVRDKTELARQVTGFLLDVTRRDEYGQRARQLVLGNRGGVDRVMELLHDYLVD